MDYRYLLSLGSNLGNRHAHLMRGIQLLGCEVTVRSVTRLMETLPLPSARYVTADHEPYLNCVVDCESDLDAQHLYDEVICPIEDVVGHSREEKWRPRELDVDVLFWAHNDAPTFHLCTPLKVRSDRGFSVPHTDVWTRPFLMDLIESDLKIDSRRLRSF